MSTVLFTITGSIATITLNRPEKLNAFTREMALSLQDHLRSCTTNNAVRAVVITGAGKAFSAGQDLAEVTDPQGEGMEKILSEQLNPIIMLIRNMDKPVLAVVNGVAAGAGANIALCCDLVLASDSAKFIQAFSLIGLIPDSGGTYFLPRLVGYQRAAGLMMLGEQVSGQQAAAMGMIYRSFEAEKLQEEAEKIIQTIAAMPTRALALTKKALLSSASNTLNEQLELEDQLQAEAAQTADFREGVDAFTNKRKPLFTGA